MESVVQNLEHAAGTLHIPMPTASSSTREGATTPAAKRLSRPTEAINIPHKKVSKICCIGAGYVGALFALSNSSAKLLTSAVVQRRTAQLEFRARAVLSVAPC